jgi:hypothetical protein
MGSSCFPGTLHPPGSGKLAESTIFASLYINNNLTGTLQGS